MVNILKQIQNIDVSTKGVRGISNDLQVLQSFAVPVMLLPTALVFARPIAESGAVSLKPGGETTATVTLSDKIPADANFTRFGAGLAPVEDKTTPAKLQQESVITEDGGTPKTFKVDISLPAAPTNLSVSLPGGQPFWSFSQPMTESNYVFPDLAQEVNAYLDRSLTETGKVDFPVKLPFVIQSAGGGKVKVQIYSLTYVRLKTESWTNEMDGTVRLDRNLALQFAQVETITLSSLDDATGLTLNQIRMDLGGQFGPERLLGSVAVPDGREFATISPEYSLAQGCRLDNPVQAVGLTAPWSNDSDAEIYVEIQNDNNGMPAAASPLAQASLKLPPPQGAAAGWQMVKFQKPVDLQADTPYWLVLKGVRGQVRQPLQKQENLYLGHTLVNRSGQLWKPFQLGQSGSIPLLRLLYQPGLDNQTAAVVLRLQGTDVRQPLDPVSSGQQVTLKPPADSVLPVVLVIESQAQGTLSLANLVQEYQSSKT